MPSVSPTLVSLLLSTLLYSPVLSRHINRDLQLHRHFHKRQDASPIFVTATVTSTTAASVSSVPDGNAVAADINEIQNELTLLEGGVLQFINAIEQRVQDLESLLNSAPTNPTSSASLTGTATTMERFTDLSPVPTPSTSSLTAATSQSALCDQPFGSGPPVPCPLGSSTSTEQSTAMQVVTSESSSEVASGSSGMLDSCTSPTQYWTGTSLSTLRATATLEILTLPNASPTVSSSVADRVIPSTDSTYSASASPAPYTFDANARDNVAVYYGQTPGTQAGGLLALCQNPNVDIAILAFVYDFFGPNGYPTLGFGPGCTAPNTDQAQQGPGLQDCSSLAPEIAGCQQIGKKVLVSVGGAFANSAFASDEQAQEFATTLWELFGPLTEFDPNLRPFGAGVVVDGFDIDNENHDTSYYQTFATALRQLFTQDPSKAYYLSAAPQCPFPDESIPARAMAVADFIWVQFYNNPSCNLNSDGFQASFEAWSTSLDSASGTPGKPRLYIGAGAFDGAGSGYVEGSNLSSVINLVTQLNVDNLGGIMLWDGSEALANVDQSGVNYLDYAKSALTP